MNPVRLYFTPIPSSCHGLVFPAFDSEYGEQYIILLNEHYSFEAIRASLMHELWHIWNGDLTCMRPLDEVEKQAHYFFDYEGPLFYPRDFSESALEIMQQEIRHVSWEKLEAVA